MIPRWLVVLRHGTGSYYYAGKRRTGSVWVPKKDAATKFVSQDQAESFALLVTTEEPEVIAKLEVVEYGEAKDGAPSMADRQARR